MYIFLNKNLRARVLVALATEARETGARQQYELIKVKPNNNKLL